MSSTQLPLIPCRVRVQIETLTRTLDPGDLVWARPLRRGRYDLLNDQHRLLVSDCPGGRLQRLSHTETNSTKDHQ